MPDAYKFPDGRVLLDGKEAPEVELRTLKPGAEFCCMLEHGPAIPGVLLSWNECSALVWLTTRKARTIKLSDGKEVPIQPVTGATRWSSQTLVVPAGTRREDFQQLLDNIYKGETNMAKAKAAKVNGKEAKAAKAAPKPKVYNVATYEPAAKASTDKGKELAGKPSHNGVLLAAIVKHGKLTFPQLIEAVPAKVFGSASKAVENIYRWHVQDLIKKGFVKSVDAKVEAVSLEEARTEGVEA